MPSFVFNATSHSSRAHWEAVFHQFPELRQGPDAARTTRRLFLKNTERGFSPSKSTEVSRAGRNIRKAMPGAAAGALSASSALPENASTAKLSGWWESRTLG